MNETININGISYLVIPADVLQQMFGITIVAEFGLVYGGPESGVFTDKVIEVPESVTVEGQTVPVVGFAGGLMALSSQNEFAAASVTEVVLPSSTLFLMLGFYGFTNLQKVTCYAESTPKLSSELGESAGIDFEGTPEKKELYIPSGSDYSTWETETTWASVNEIYDGFVEIVNRLKYKETGETTVALIGYDDTFNSTSITIPSTITHEGKTYTVTEIRKNSFENYTGLTEVNIPNSVTKISETAFSNTYLEETQTISVNNISLNVISIDTRLDKFLLRNTSGITFTYGDITETTTEYACECLGLTDATIPTPTLDLTNLIHDNNKISIYTIKERAFANNNSIITAILPEETNLIEGDIFDNCQNLDTIYFNCKSVTPLISSNYGPELFFGNNSYIKTIIIGNSVTSIGNYAFLGCSSLTSIDIPNSVTSIGIAAFAGCSSLTSVTIPNSVTSIGLAMFSGCSSLSSVTIGNSVTSIGEQAFQNCSSLTSITIPNSVTSIGSHAFCECYYLTSVTIPNNVTFIGESAFYGCLFIKSSFINNSSLDEVANNYWEATIGDEITDEGLVIQENVVIDARKNITSATIPDGITSIGNYAFLGCSDLTSVTIPDSVTSIGHYAFQTCSDLTSIVIPDGVTSIGGSAFQGTGLTSVTIPDSVTSIGNYMFQNCRNLTSVTIGSGITSIGTYMFNSCSSLTSVYLLNPTAPTSYSNTFLNTPSTKVLFTSIDATGYSTSWGSTTWAAVNPVMVPTDEIVYKFNDEHLLETFSSNSKTESLTIPHNVLYKGIGYNVEKVSRNSLANDYKIKSLTIESGINKIEASALSGCNNLETVNIPDSVTKIDNHAFWMCKNLKTINLPSTLNKLKPEMFVACEELQEITIPNGITKIPFRMFEGCKNLKTVNLPSTINKIQWSAFKDCKNLTTINIPSGCTVDSTAFEGTNITV